MIVIINVFAIAIILFIIWWFWLSKPKASKAIHSNEFDITVESGIYTPSIIEADKEQPKRKPQVMQSNLAGIAKRQCQSGCQYQ